METNTKTLKRGWVKFYIIYFIIYGIIFSLLLKYKLSYLIPILVFLLGIIERKFRKDSRDVTWKDLISLFDRRKTVNN